jgi:glycerol-3-phosphate acyltransferase PlsX
VRRPVPEVLTVAVDAMGGDSAPGEVVAGAVAAAEAGIPVLLVGRAEEIGDTGGIEVLPAAEVIAMHDEPGPGVRRKKNASVVVAAEAVRDRRAAAMVSAGNTGAAMASALLRMGRLPGVSRPAIAAPLPVPGALPSVLVDAGANAECTPAWLLQFAKMGSAFARNRYGVAEPRVGLLSIGEEPTKGTPLVKEAHALLAGSGLNFVGNVEGRDVLTDDVDVVVTDGFTGNVLLKALEGGLAFFVSLLHGAVESSEEAREAGKVILPLVDPFVEELEPESTGGAMLLGVEGVCVISHGSSSAQAVLNAVKVAHELALREVVEDIRASVAS